MAVSKQQKTDILNNLIERFKNAKSIGFAQTTTVTVEEFFKLRKSLREVGATYTLAKKTLIKKALKEAIDIEVDITILPGQVGVLCSNEDSISGLSKLNDFIKASKDKVVWVASIFEGELKNLEDTKVIASMPSRETLLGRLVGSLQSPLSALARFFDAASKDLEEKKKQKVGELEGNKETKVEETKVEEAKVEEAKVEETKVEEAKVEEVKVETKEEVKTEEVK